MSKKVKTEFNGNAYQVLVDLSYTLDYMKDNNLTFDSIIAAVADEYGWSNNEKNILLKTMPSNINLRDELIERLSRSADTTKAESVNEELNKLIADVDDYASGVTNGYIRVRNINDIRSFINLLTTGWAEAAKEDVRFQSFFTDMEQLQQDYDIVAAERDALTSKIEQIQDILASND